MAVLQPPTLARLGLKSAKKEYGITNEQEGDMRSIATEDLAGTLSERQVNHENTKMHP